MKFIHYIIITIIILFASNSIVSTKTKEQNYTKKIDSFLLSNAFFIYKGTPWQGEEFNISIDGIQTIESHSITMLWSIIKEPKGSQLTLKVSKDSRKVSILAKAVGSYRVRVTHPNREKMETEFTIEREFPFDISKLDNYDKDKNISEIWHPSPPTRHFK